MVRLITALDRVRAQRTLSDMNWVSVPRNDPSGPAEIPLHLKNVRVLITQTCSQSPCDLTDTERVVFFWQLALTCIPDTNRPTRWIIFLEISTDPVLTLSVPHPRDRQFRGSGAQFVRCGTIWSDAVISRTVMEQNRKCVWIQQMPTSWLMILHHDNADDDSDRT